MRTIGLLFELREFILSRKSNLVPIFFTKGMNKEDIENDKKLLKMYNKNNNIN